MGLPLTYSFHPPLPDTLPYEINELNAFWLSEQPRYHKSHFPSKIHIIASYGVYKDRLAFSPCGTMFWWNGQSLPMLMDAKTIDRQMRFWGIRRLSDRRKNQLQMNYFAHKLIQRDNFELTFHMRTVYYKKKMKILCSQDKAAGG